MMMPYLVAALAGVCVTMLLAALYEQKLDAIKTENLYLFDGVPGFSLGQGQ